MYIYLWYIVSISYCIFTTFPFLSVYQYVIPINFEITELPVCCEVGDGILFQKEIITDNCMLKGTYRPYMYTSLILTFHSSNIITPWSSLTHLMPDPITDPPV